MEIKVNRLLSNATDTIGTVEINNVLKYYGMEPPKTAPGFVPAGTYNVIWYFSPKHQIYLPYVEVPNDAGIEIHVGDFPTDSLGCLLIADNIVNEAFQNNSVPAVNEFYANFDADIKAGIACTITYIDLFTN
jgi:hypothetical protein